MSDYIVSARKYRPATFKSVVGQKNLTATLKNAIDSKRLAQAYLFCGPRGVGKTSCARIFAKTINCLNPTADGEACGECESCKSIDQGNSYNIIELDAASNNSVDNIRNLTEEVNVPPHIGDYRVFIIDEVHMLSQSAFNAFLKTLEEPPKYAVFILATTEKHKVIPTILSRCQIYDFKRITTTDILDHLKYVAEEEGIEAAPEALNVIARKADGAMRDALSIFDQVAASSMGKITYESALENLNVLDYDYYFRLVEAFRAGDGVTPLLIFNEILEKGFNTLFFINGLASHIRDLMVAADTRSAKLLEVAEEVIEKYTAQATSLPLQWYYAALKIINDTDLAYRTSTNKQLLVELMLVRLSQLLTPPTVPFDRVDNEPPLSMPAGPLTGGQPTPAAQKPPKTESEKSASSAPVEEKAEEPQSSAPAKPIAEKKPVKAAAGGGAKKKTPAKTTRLKDIEAEYEKENEQKSDRREPFNPDQVLTAWDEFIAVNDDKPLLVDAMKANKPSKISEEEYSVEVSHPAQKQAFESNMTAFLKYMRDAVKNDFLSFDIKITELDNIKKPMPPKDLFTDMLKENPGIGKIANMLDVEIV